MATLRLPLPLFFLLLLSLIFTQIASHAPPEAAEDHSSELGDSALKHELDRLKSRISFLESLIKERSHASSNEDENIRDSEVPIQETSDSMQPLENEIEYLQHKASADGKKQTSNSHARASELEKQSYMASHWNESWRPALDKIQKFGMSFHKSILRVWDKKDQLKSWAEPQIRDVETHFIPRMKDNWSKFINHLEPHLQSLLPKTIDVFDSSKRSLMPRLVKARTVMGHYMQEVKKFSEPYVGHFVMVTSRYETMQVAFEPYINKTIHAYRKLIKSASIYHHQVQETLKSHELTRPLAAWFPGNDKQKEKGTH